MDVALISDCKISLQELNKKIKTKVYPNWIKRFDDLDKIFVERINIFGNFITDEKVIRNSLIVDEGDAFNEVLFNKSTYQ